MSQRIDDGQAPRDEAVLHILGKKERAARLCRCGDDQRIPELQLVVDNQICGRKRGLHLRSRCAEGLRELQKDGASLLSIGPAAAQYDEQLAQGLGRCDETCDIAELFGQIANSSDLDLVLGTATYPREIGEDIAVQRNAGPS